MQSLIPSFLIIGLSFAVSLGLTVWVRRLLLRRAVLDIPNERSSHTTPTPRGGGWAVVITLVLGMILTAMFGHGNNLFAIWIILGTIMLAIISWMDDRRGLSPLLRLGLHLAAATLGTLALDNGFNIMPFMGDNHQVTLLGGALPFALDRLLMIVGWAWFMNLYNFMDGIDGITGVETISIATSLCVVISATGLSLPFVDNLTLLLTGACLGFLVLNWHPAKIFLGDIGSVPLGFLVGFALLTLATHGFFVPALILPLYYLADSGITLTRRALRGEKIWQAHRQHFYQHAARGLGRHDRALYPVILCNIVLLPCAIVAMHHPLPGLALGMLAVSILLSWMHKIGHK